MKPLSAAFHFATAYAVDKAQGLPRAVRQHSIEELLDAWEHIDRCTVMLARAFPEREFLQEILEGFWQGQVVPAIEAELQRRSRPKPQASGRVGTLKALDIAEVAGRYTELRPAGAGKQKGRCPIHKEKTPSFWVYQDSGRWRCYGACATGGDVIDLLSRMGARK